MNKKCVYCMLVFLVVTMSQISFSANIKKGLTFHVPGWQWIDYLEGDKPDTCGIDYGFTVEVVGVISENEVIIKYHTTGGVGTESDDGTKFNTATNEVLQFEDRYQERFKKEESVKKEIMKILSGNTLTRTAGHTIGQEIEVVEDFEWVDIVWPFIPQGVSRYGDVFGGSCGISKGGKIKVMGFTSDNKVLFSYFTHLSTGGTRCDNYVMFLK